MKRYLVLLPFLFVVAATACATSRSGEAPKPVISEPFVTSDAGAAALVTGSINPETCDGILGSPPLNYTLNFQSLTNSAQQESTQIEAMCSAVYQPPNTGESSLAVALIKFDSDAPAIERYDLIKSAFVALDLPISEINNADDDLVDRVSAVIDSDGIGQTTVMRQNNWVLTASIGPTIDDSLWTPDDLQIIGESILERIQQ